MALTRESTLHYWEANYGLHPIVGGKAVFARVSEGTHQLAANKFFHTTWPANKPRLVNSKDAYLDAASNGYYDGAALVVEPERENGLYGTDTFAGADWTRNAGTTVTASTKPNPTVAHALDEVTSANGSHAWQQRDLLVSGTEWQCVSIRVLKDAVTDRFPTLEVELVGGTTVTAWVSLNTSTGETHVSGGEGGAWDMGTHWRLWVSVQNNNSGNNKVDYRFGASHSANIDRTGGHVTGTCDVWGPQWEKGSRFPTSYRGATAAAALLRNQDDIYWECGFSPQRLIAYFAFNPFPAAGLGTGQWRRVLAIGEADGTCGVDVYYEATIADRLVQKISWATATFATSGVSNVSLEGLPLVEGCAIWDGANSRLLLSREGGSVLVGPNSTASVIPELWDRPRITLGNHINGHFGGGHYRALKIVKRDDVVGTTNDEIMEEMRRFTLSPDWADI